RIPRPEGGKQRLVLLQRLLSYSSVEHQAEDVQVDMLIDERRTDDVVARYAHDIVMEIGIGARKTRIARISINRSIAVAHVSGGGLEFAKRIRRHVERRKACPFRFEQQSERV